jgi:peptidoglycan/xylan/chitin deacetylase (PgdA/CDA1 family)
MLEEGHVLGSHTWSHRDPRTASARELLHEYRDGRRAVEDIVGKEVPLFRPPMGHISLKSVTAIRLARVRPWMWNCDPGDWRPGVSRGRETWQRDPFARRDRAAAGSRGS